MQKRAVFVLIIMFFIVLVLNVVLLFRYNGYASSSAQGQISLQIIAPGGVSCGDGTCNGAETCSSCPADCGSCSVTPGPSGGGGGATPVTKKDFSISTDLIKVLLKKGESFKTSIVVKNTEKSSQNFEFLLSPSLEEFVSVSETGFTLQGGEEKIVYLNFISSEKTEPGVYTGLLKIKTADKTKEVSIIDTIKSYKVLFDISLDIPSKYKELLAGEELLLQTSLFNLGDLGKTDVKIEYIIKDFEGNILLEESEVVGVETQVSFSKMIKLSSNLKPGDYVAIVQARYDGSLGGSNSVFRIVEKKSELPTFTPYLLFLAVAGVLSFFMIVFFLLFLRNEKGKLRNIIKNQSSELQKINEEIVSKKVLNKKIGEKNFNIVDEDLSRKLNALEKAFASGYISKEAYSQGKLRIEKIREKAKKKYL